MPVFNYVLRRPTEVSKIKIVRVCSFWVSPLDLFNLYIPAHTLSTFMSFLKRSAFLLSMYVIPIFIPFTKEKIKAPI